MEGSGSLQKNTELDQGDPKTYGSGTLPLTYGTVAVSWNHPDFIPGGLGIAWFKLKFCYQVPWGVCIPKYHKIVQKSTAYFEAVSEPTRPYCFKLYHGIGDLLSMVSSEPLSFGLMCAGKILLNGDVSLRVFEHPSLRHPLVPVLGQHRGLYIEKYRTPPPGGGDKYGLRGKNIS